MSQKNIFDCIFSAILYTRGKLNATRKMSNEPTVTYVTETSAERETEKKTKNILLAILLVLVILIMFGCVLSSEGMSIGSIVRRQGARALVHQGVVGAGLPLWMQPGYRKEGFDMDLAMTGGMQDAGKGF